MRTRHSQRGVTLIELLVALALLAFVLLGITPLFMASVKSNFSANEYTSIHVLARDRLEQLMNLPFTDDQLKAGDHCVTLPATLPTGARNPFTVTYKVIQFQIPPEASVAKDAPFVPTQINAAGQLFHYKQVDVTVKSGTGPLGIGTRATMVSDCLANPSTETILSITPIVCP